MLTIEDIIQKVKVYSPHINEAKLIKAYKFAEEAHTGQTRKSGDLYISHPLEAANILTEFGADETVLIASLLHDVPEDTNRTLNEIKQKFGHDVAFLVDGITKLSVVHYRHDMEQRQIASLRKLLLHSTKDARVILIKLADRLHNMRTLHFIPRQDKQLRIARETLEIYIPIANLLGIYKIKRELEDLCFKFLLPLKYEALKGKVDFLKGDKDFLVKRMKSLMEKFFKEKHLKAQIQNKGRSLYSIYRKLEKRGTKDPQVLDLLTLRIIVEKKEQCYIVLGMIHELFQPKPGKVKDYIVMPKSNGYQSLHTTVFGIDGISTDIVIKTVRMQMVADYGIAARFLYGQSRKDYNEAEKMWWAKRILELQKEIKNNEDFLDNLKGDIFQDRVFNFTPKGDIIDLPSGANCIDFAYAIHSQIGNTAGKAEIDGKEQPITTILGSGQTVRIINDENQKMPPLEWLDVVKTSVAQRKIRDKLKSESKENKITLGRNILAKTLTQAGKNFSLEFRGRRLNHLLNELKLRNLNEVFTKVGEGALTSKFVLKSLYKGGRYLEGDRTNKLEEFYTIGLKIKSEERVGILQEMLTKVSGLQVNIEKIGSIVVSQNPSLAITKMYVEVRDFDELKNVFQVLEEVNGVYEVVRLPSAKKIIFYVSIIFSFLFWAIHPVLMSFLLRFHNRFPYLAKGFIYLELISIFGIVFCLHLITQKTFPHWENNRFYWISSFLLIILATITIVIEANLFAIDYRWEFIGLVTCLLSFLLALQYYFVAKEKKKQKEVD